MKRTVFVIGILIISLIFIVRLLNRQAGDIQTEVKAPEVSQASSQTGQVSVVLDYGDGSLATYSARAKTVYEVLETVASKAAIPIETERYDFGVFVKSIDGRLSTAERAWIYFVNGESGQVGADQYQIYPGDVVTWRYIESN